MDIERAKELISVLADGVDPLTGEVLEDDHLCNNPEIIRAMNVVLEELKKRPKRGRKICLKTPASHGQRTMMKSCAGCLMTGWIGNSYVTTSNERRVCDHFKRTPGGIASRLVRLGKIKERDEFWKRQG